VVVGNYANSRVFLYQERPRRDALTADLLADIRGFPDNLKAPLELVECRVKFYRLAISSILESVGVPTERLRFVLGSSF